MSELNVKIADLLGERIIKEFGYLPPNFSLELAKIVADHNEGKLVKNKVSPHKFMAISSKSHSLIAGEIADNII